MNQSISSAGTARNILPASLSKIEWEPGTINADIGGGKYDKATDYLDERGVRNVVYDPFNRSDVHNNIAIDLIQNGQSHTATVNNVLNTIREASVKDEVIQQAANAVMEDGTVYLLIHEGDKSGKGKKTRDGWQENRRAASYVLGIKKHFHYVERRGTLIIASVPK